MQAFQLGRSALSHGTKNIQHKDQKAYDSFFFLQPLLDRSTQLMSIVIGPLDQVN